MITQEGFLRYNDLMIKATYAVAKGTSSDSPPVPAFILAPAEGLF
jgi:hypothetical protein